MWSELFTSRTQSILVLLIYFKNCWDTNNLIWHIFLTKYCIDYGKGLGVSVKIEKPHIHRDDMQTSHSLTNLETFSLCLTSFQTAPVEKHATNLSMFSFKTIESNHFNFTFMNNPWLLQWPLPNHSLAD